MEISAIPLVMTPVAAGTTTAPAAIDGMFFLDLLSELSSQTSEATTDAESTASWTLINPEALTNSDPEKNAVEVVAERPNQKERGSDLLTFTAPVSPAQVVQAPPLSFEINVDWASLQVQTGAQDPQPVDRTEALPEVVSVEGKVGEAEAPAATGDRVRRKGDELAFSARISNLMEPAERSSTEHVPAVRGLRERSTPVQVKASHVAYEETPRNERKEPSHSEQAHSSHDHSPPFLPLTAEPTPAVSGHQKAGVGSADVPSPIANIEPAAEPVHAKSVSEVAVAIDGEEGRLRLRMESRSGELRAWVTGTTPDAVDRVRAELPDLTRSLREAGFRSQLWMPDSVRQAVPASELHASMEHGQGSFDRYDGQREHESPRRRPQPDWLEQFEES